MVSLKKKCIGNDEKNIHAHIRAVRVKVKKQLVELLTLFYTVFNFMFKCDF